MGASRVSNSGFAVWEKRLGKLVGRGMSARAAALELGLPPRTVQRWLKGGEKPVRVSRRGLPDPVLEAWAKGEDEPKGASGKARTKTFILTSWEVRVGVNEAFLDCLLQMAKHYDAELLISSIWPEDVKWMPAALKTNFTLNHGERDFNSNLRFKYVPTHALVKSPLAGWRGAHPGQSVIIPGLIRELVTETSRKTGKQTMATGSIGQLDAALTDYNFLAQDDRYNFARRWAKVQDRRGGSVTALATNYVVPSALVVEVLDDDSFVTRYVTMTDGKSVYDLGTKFTAGSSQAEFSTPSALVVGDTHAWTVDDDSWEATLDMVRQLDPAEVILNDFFDGAAINHHEIGSAFKRHGFPSLEDEAAMTRALLTTMTELANRVVYLQSNHDNFLEKWLDMGTSAWLGNYELALELELDRVQNERHPIETLLRFEEHPTLHFHSDAKPFFVGDVSVIHGHTGVGGRPASFKTLAQVYNHLVSGHTHSPAVFRNAVNVGHTCKREQAYAKGANGWFPANALIQPDGNTQLLPIVEGRWRGEAWAD